ncbi:hypothetical protein AGMMS50276_08480 [Synergistales bacterium]|nr:hypothetical protein AGMMS50276_08480 [Synergistales bacterium]
MKIATLTDNVPMLSVIDPLFYWFKSATLFRLDSLNIFLTSVKAKPSKFSPCHLKGS